MVEFGQFLDKRERKANSLDSITCIVGITCPSRDFLGYLDPENETRFVNANVVQQLLKKLANPSRMQYTQRKPTQKKYSYLEDFDFFAEKILWFVQVLLSDGLDGHRLIGTL